MRTYPANVLAALAAGTYVERWIVRVTLPGGVFGASDSPDTFPWDNGSGPVSYVGCDTALVVTVPPVQAQLRQDPATVLLSATDPRLLAQLLNEDYHAAATDICVLVFLNGVPAYEVLKFRGWMDQASFEERPIRAPTPGAGSEDEQPQIATVSVTVTPKTVDMKRASGRWATDVDQRTFRDASDDFFQDVAMVGVSTINWGQAGASSPAGSASSSPAGAPSGVAALVGAINVNPLNNFV